MSYRYQATNNEKDDNQLIQGTKNVYYRAICSSERQKLSSNDDEQSNFKQDLYQRQMPNTNFQFSQLFKDCDLSNACINFNYNFNK